MQIAEKKFEIRIVAVGRLARYHENWPSQSEWRADATVHQAATDTRSNNS